MSGYDVAPKLRAADILLIIPPFAWQDRPAIGAHLLQAIGRQCGVEVQVLYANILFARYFGEVTHTTLTKMQYGLFLGERLFARAAFGVPSLGRDGGESLAEKLGSVRDLSARGVIDMDGLRTIEAAIPTWLETFCPAIGSADYSVVGASTSFEQTSASIAMLAQVKQASPKTTTILGGANCEGEMAEGIHSLTDIVDVVFSGESEQTFAAFARGLKSGELPKGRIIYGTPCTDLDELPTPDYSDYYKQMEAWAHGSSLAKEMHLTYETSRGCWWGQKNHCTFCGLNGEGMAMREKSPDRVIGELSTLLAAHPTGLVAMTDNIMPRSYFKTLLPRLSTEVPGATIMYEQKANLNLAEVEALMAAGVREIQPGIEALSSGLLKLMKKGTTAAQNIDLLRFARATGMKLHWNLLVGFPNDKLSFYTELLDLLPLLVHLQPPHPPCPVVIDRFSPYFDHPNEYGIENLRPFDFYEGVLPERTDLAKLAYHFQGDFVSESLQSPELIRTLAELVHRWRVRFHSSAPAELRVLCDGDDYHLVDTRGIDGNPTEQSITDKQAAMALVTTPARSRSESDETSWALGRGVSIKRDGRFVALAIAEPRVIHQLTKSSRRPLDLLAQAG